MNTDRELTFPKGSISNRQFWNLVITSTNRKDKPNTEQNAQNVSLLRGHCSHGQMLRLSVSQRVLWKHCKLKHSLNCTTFSQGHWFYHFGFVTQKRTIFSFIESIFDLPIWFAHLNWFRWSNKLLLSRPCFLTLTQILYRPSEQINIIRLSRLWGQLTTFNIF